jgi:hypothetical protein
MKTLRRLLVPVAAGVVLLVPFLGLAQSKALATIEEDVQAFSIAPDNQIAFATQRIKRIKKAYVEHDDFWMADSSGKHKKIIDGDKFMVTDKQLS